MQVHRLFPLAVMVSMLLSCPSLVSAGDSQVSVWPQWRGPNRDGQISPTNWPERLTEENFHEIWSQTLGPSYSGPIVTKDLVFVTETVDEQDEVVRALDRATGGERWSTEWSGAIKVPFFAKENGDWIRSTPAYDNGRLYVAGMRDVLVCLDAQNGSEIWKVDFVEQLDTKVPDFGFVCSPLVVGDYVYVQAGASFIKLDKLTGEIVWRTLEDGGGMFGSAFSSPVLATINGQPELLVQTRSKLAGVQPDSGEELWSREIPAFRGMNILPPTVVGNSVLTSSYGGRTFLFDTPSSGAESTELIETWNNKSQGYMSSPVVVGDYVYLHLRNQRFTCIELSTGESMWTTTPFGKYWSMVVNGDRILALDERGELLLIRANPEEFELIDRLQVSDDSTWAHLAVCDHEVFIRELRGMAVYRWQDTTDSAANSGN